MNTSISTLFEDSDVTFRINPPVAAASLGQVYKARLKKGAGTGAGIGTGEVQAGNDVPEYVAVKVQRPNMKLKVREYTSDITYYYILVYIHEIMLYTRACNRCILYNIIDAYSFKITCILSIHTHITLFMHI